MAYVIKCLDWFINPREIGGAAIRDGLSVGTKKMRKFIVFATPGKDTLIVIGPPLDPEAEKYPRFYYHKNIRTVAEELYRRTDISGGGQIFFVTEEIDGVRQDGALLNGTSSDFGVYPAELASDPEAKAALEAWYGGVVVVA